MFSRRAFIATSLATLGACVSPAKTPAKAPAKARTKAPLGRAYSALAPPFDFHCGFWLNLHHLLYARAAAGGDQKVAQAERLMRDLEPSSFVDRIAWNASTTDYRDRFSTKDLLFDDELAELKTLLAAQEDAESLVVPNKFAFAATALKRVEPSYRSRAWSKHRQRCVDWISAAQPLVEEHGASIMGRLAELFRTPWVSTQLRVDVCVNANWAGGYTSIDPLHIVIASDDTRNQGNYALEILFHEASHTMIRNVRDAVAEASKRAGKKEPPQLWHAILFYTSGTLITERIAGHVMYAEREGLWKKVWPSYLVALKRWWQPYLDGATTYEEALTSVVRGVG